MGFWESIIYGFISGLTEFLPVSSQGHQAVLMQLFGMQSREPLTDFFVHVGVLLVLLSVVKPVWSHIRRDASAVQRRAGRGGFASRLIKTAVLPMIIGLLFYISAGKIEANILWIVPLYILNGLILLIPEYIRHGNKDARFMTALDGVFLGIAGAVSAVPGLSRVGFMNGYCLARGADRQKALNWILVLSIPAVIVFLGFDVYHMVTLGFGIGSFMDVVRAVLAGVLAGVGGYFGILCVRFLTMRTGFASLAYYSFGLAFFSFILYLIA